MPQLPSKNSHENSGWQQDLIFQRHKPTVAVDSTGGDEAMNMWMDAQISAPGVQRRNDSGTRAEILGIAKKSVE